MRLDTFEAEKETAVFYVGTNDPDELTEIRRHILARFENLPIAGEYIHRDAYDVAAKYGKDTFLFIQKAGTDRMPAFFAAKAKVDAHHRAPRPRRHRHRPRRAGRRRAGAAAPAGADERLPRPLRAPPAAAHGRRRHRRGARPTSRPLFPSATGDVFECTPAEGKAAFLHRFAVAGAAVRYRAVHPREVEDIVALDIALRRNDRDWVERLPPEIDAQIEKKLYYGHFFCHVFHQDYVVKKGHDCLALEHAMWKLLDARGAEYPAEHNVGHLYHAKPALAGFYRVARPRPTA